VLNDTGENALNDQARLSRPPIRMEVLEVVERAKARADAKDLG